MKICGGDFNPEKGLTPDDCGLPVLHAEGVNTTPAGLPGWGPRNKGSQNREVRLCKTPPRRRLTSRAEMQAKPQRHSGHRLVKFRSTPDSSLALSYQGAALAVREGSLALRQPKPLLTRGLLLGPPRRPPIRMVVLQAASLRQAVN